MRNALITLASIAVLVIGFQGCKKANAISWVPTPCVTASAGTPEGAGGALPCQPTFPGYAASSPTPGPILFSPGSYQFASATSSPTTVAISESYFVGTFASPVASPGGVVTISAFSSSNGTGSFTLSPAGNGTTTITIANIGGTGQTGSMQVGVSTPAPTPTPTPGAISFNPTALSFANPSATSQTDTISQVNWSGGFSISSLPGYLTSSISGSTLTVGPNGTGAGSTPVIISGGLGVTASLPITVAATPQPTPGAISLNPSTVNLVGTGLSAPTPGTATITQAHYTGPWALSSSSPAGIASPSISGSTITVRALNAGSTTIDVSGGGAASPVPLTVNVSPVPGPISGPVSIAFSGPTAAPTTVPYSEANYSGTFAISSPSPAAIVSASITNSGGVGTVTLTPIAAGTASANVTDTNGQTLAISLSVNPTPGPLLVSPNPIVFSGATSPPQTFVVSDPYNTGAITASPTPSGQVGASAGATANPGAANFTATFLASPIAIGTPSIVVTDTNGNSVSVPVVVSTVTPGPIVASPGASLTFTAQAGVPTPVAVGLTESNYSQGFSTTDSNSAIATTAVSGSNLSITAVSGGTETVTVTNMSVPSPQSTTLSVTVQTPAPVYTDYTPYPNPTATAPVIWTPPTPSVYTILAQVQCGTAQATPNPAGNDILNIGLTSATQTLDVDLNGGLCNSTTMSNAANPSDATGAHIYTNGNYAQSLAPYGLINGAAANQQYIVAATNNGAFLTFWDCLYNGTTVGTCTQGTPVATGPTTYAGTTSFIGGATAGTPSTRVFVGYIWNAQVIASALLWPSNGTNSTGLMQSWVAANYATAMPYATPAPTPTPTATPTPGATPIFFAARPYNAVATTGPLATAFPVPAGGSYTFIAQIRCGLSSPYPVVTPNSTGNDIASMNSGSGVGANISAGLCNSPATNPTDSTGAHVYDAASSAQANAAASLVAGTSYVIAVTNGGTGSQTSSGGGSLIYWTCTYPLGTCTNTTTPPGGSAFCATGCPTGVGFIGGANTSQRLFGGQIWNTQLYGYLLPGLNGASPNSMATALAALPTSTPYANPYSVPSPSPSPSSSAGTSVNYPGPNYPTWPNALSATATIAPSIAAGQIKSYDPQARAFYLNYYNNNGGSALSGAVPGWGLNGVWVTNQVGTAAGTFSDGLYIAQNSDPTYTMYGGGCSSYGCLEILSPITNVHIPLGAVPENYQNNCGDCHLQLVEPLGWVPCNGTCGSVTYPNVSPNKYEIDVFLSGTSQSCVGISNQECSLWNNSPGQALWGNGIQLISTASYGWGQCCSANVERDFFHPGNSQPTNTGSGTSYAATYAFTSLVITPWDIAQNAINHETGMYDVCNQDSAADVWPSFTRTSDQYCSLEGGTNSDGWAYGDHLWLNRTVAQINQDAINCSGTGLCGSAGKLSPIQVIYAKSLALYGAVVTDVGYSGGPVFVPVVKTSDTDWANVATQFGLASSNNSGVSGYLLNLGLPMNYFLTYMHAINSCTYYPKPYTSSC